MHHVNFVVDADVVWRHEDEVAVWAEDAVCFFRHKQVLTAVCLLAFHYYLLFLIVYVHVVRFFALVAFYYLVWTLAVDKVRLAVPAQRLLRVLVLRFCPDLDRAVRPLHHDRIQELFFVVVVVELLFFLFVLRVQLVLEHRRAPAARCRRL